MKVSAFSLFALIGALAPCAQAAEKVGDTPKCVVTGQIAGALLVNDKTIVVQMKKDAGYKRVDLADVCELDDPEAIYKGFGAALCVSKALGVKSRTGKPCVVSHIVNVEAAEATSLMQQTYTNPDDALAAADKELAVNPRNAGSLTTRGWALMKKGNHAEAVAALTTALEINPKNDLAWEFRGAAHEGLGQYREALADYRKALEFVPDSKDIKLMLEAVERKLRQ